MTGIINEEYSQFPFDELGEFVVLYAVLTKGDGFHVQVVEQYIRLIVATLVPLLPRHRIFESIHKVDLCRYGAAFFETFADGADDRTAFFVFCHVRSHTNFYPTTIKFYLHGEKRKFVGRPNRKVIERLQWLLVR